MGIVAVLGISWVFILGILVGRGYRPEEAVPELAQIMPSTETPATLESSQPPTVLKPEELQFMEDLQGKAGSAETITVDSTQKAPAPKSSPALPGGASGGLVGRDLPMPRLLTKPHGARRSPGRPRSRADLPPGLGRTRAQRRSRPPRPAEPHRPPAQDEASPRAGFVASYQVASFFKKDQPTRWSKLAKHGFRAEIRQARILDKDVFASRDPSRTEQEISAGLE